MWKELAVMQALFRYKKTDALKRQSLDVGICKLLTYRFFLNLSHYVSYLPVR